MAPSAAPDPEAGSQKVPNNVDKNSKYYKLNELPVDRGWAWVICFAGFVSMMMYGFASQFPVVMFLEIVIMYETTITVASLMFTCALVSFSVLSLIITAVILPRLGERRLVMLSGLFYSVASVGYSVSPNIYVFICCAIIKGAAAGGMYVPGICLIRQYFHKRRSIAQIIATTGQSAAVIIAPPIIRLIRKQYGISGTFLLLAALELHLVVAGLLLRPVDTYKFRPVLSPLPHRGQNKRKNAAGMSKVQNGEKPGHQTSNDEESVLQLTGQNLEEGENKHIETNHVSPQGKLENGDLPMAEAQNSSVTEKLLANNGDPTQLRNRNVDHEGGDDKEKDKEDERYSDTAHYASALSLASEAGAQAAVQVVIGENGEKSKGAGKQKWKCLLPSCGYAFSRTWAFRMLLLLSMPAGANIYLSLYVPAITSTQGATLDESALLQTITGVVDVASKLGVGLLADTHLLTPCQIMMIAQACLGTLCQFARFFTTFGTMTVMVVIIGTFQGTVFSLMPLATIELVGVKQMMPQAFSMITTLSMLCIAAMNPIFGAIAESSGNFVLVVHLLGVCCFVTAAMLLTLPLLTKLDEKNAKK